MPANAVYRTSPSASVPGSNGTARPFRPLQTALRPRRTTLFGVFGDKVGTDTRILCEGSKSYGVLARDGQCAVALVPPDGTGFNHINTVSSSRSFMKERHRNAPGFAIPCLNRYDALSSTAYRSADFIADDSFASIESTRVQACCIYDYQDCFR